MQNNDLNTQGDTPREKCAWCRCKIKLIDSIKEKGDKNNKTGNYGFTEAERKVLTEIKEWVKNMPEEAPPGGLTSEEYEKLSSLGKLVSEMAHEVNNPLMIISGNAQLSLMSGPISEEVKNNLRVITEECPG